VGEEGGQRRDPRGQTADLNIVNLNSKLLIFRQGQPIWFRLNRIPTRVLLKGWDDGAVNKT
jgi:hypothetical protein